MFQIPQTGNDIAIVYLLLLVVLVCLLIVCEGGGFVVVYVCRVFCFVLFFLVVLLFGFLRVCVCRGGGGSDHIIHSVINILSIFLLACLSTYSSIYVMTRSTLY